MSNYPADTENDPAASWNEKEPVWSQDDLRVSTMLACMKDSIEILGNYCLLIESVSTNDAVPAALADFDDWFIDMIAAVKAAAEALEEGVNNRD